LREGARVGEIKPDLGAPFTRVDGGVFANFDHVASPSERLHLAFFAAIGEPFEKPAGGFGAPEIERAPSGLEVRTVTISRSAKRIKCRSHFLREELRLLPCREVPAPVDLIEVGDVGVGVVDRAARGPPGLAGEGGEADGERDLRRRLT
jgi:hypothetical protein